LRKEHSIICPTHGPLIETKRHCYNIARLFYLESIFPTPIAHWFQLASGIDKVVYISDLFENASWACESVVDYENYNSEFHSKLIRELTIFNFIWGGFESYCESYPLQPCPEPKRRGNVNAVNYFLMTHFMNKYPAISYYKEVVEYLHSLLVKNTSYGNHVDLFSPNKCVNECIIGLKVVYKIRNLFAHGVFQFDPTGGYDKNNTYDIPIINASSRIMLMTMQMLLISRGNYKNKIIISRLNRNQDIKVPSIEYISNLHLKSYKYS